MTEGNGQLPPLVAMDGPAQIRHLMQAHVFGEYLAGGLADFMELAAAHDRMHAEIPQHQDHTHDRDGD